MIKHLLLTLCIICCMAQTSDGHMIPVSHSHHNPYSGLCRVKDTATANAPDSIISYRGIRGLGDFNFGDLIGGGDLPGGLIPVGNSYDVNCHLIYDEMLYTPISIQYLGGNDIFKTNAQFLNAGEKNTEIKLKEGSYDFMAVFAPWDNSGEVPPQTMVDSYAPGYFIMIENIDVNADTDLTFDISDAKNFIQFSPRNHSGQPFMVGTVRFTEEAPGYIWDDSEANVWDVNFYNTFYNTEEDEFIYGMRSNYGHCTEDGRSGASYGNFYINDVSDKYVFYQNVVAYEGDSNFMWTVNFATHADGNKSLTNSSEYKRFTQAIGETSAAGKYVCQSHYGAEATVSVAGKSLVSYGLFYDGEDYPTCFMAEHNDAGSDFNTSTLAYPLTMELSQFIESQSMWNKAGITSCAVALANGELQYSNPFDQYFNSPIDPAVAMGTSTPILYCPFEPMEYEEMRHPIMNVEPRYIGQNGEERSIDLLETAFEARYNGELICNSISDIYRWIEEFATDGHADGAISLKFINNNIKYDGITASNITEITYNEGNEDVCPPVIKFARFKQAMPEKTGPRLSNQIAKLEILAGDMNYDGFATEYSPVDITVEYAPHGSEEFTTLNDTHLSSAYEENSEKMPIYITVLYNNMNRKSTDGWFDFRITLTDAAGNRTVQTLSPAVYIESLHDKSAINDINYTGNDHLSTEYFDMTGRQVINPQPGSLVIEKSGSSIKRIVTR